MQNACTYLVQIVKKQNSAEYNKKTLLFLGSWVFPLDQCLLNSANIY